MADPTINLKILRYRPGQDKAPVYQTYQVPFRADWVVLDAMNWVKDHEDGTLAFRWSCRMGVCGSCGMNIDGTPALACHVALSDYKAGDTIVVDALGNFPIVRDLVVDITDFMHKLKEVKAWTIPVEEKSVEQGEYLQSPAELASFKQFSMCINCLLCYAACPVYGMDSTFIGPAAIALAHRYNQDSRDGANSERIDVIGDHEGIWSCTFVGECSVVCPKSVDPAAAIQRSKVSTTMDWFTSVLLPGGNR
ncbi:MAG: succinate dehydrogenase/fumarate reductase iron-sulfur subunit [Myxococcales bacterium]|nr:succinate dehydrogenase/fumarate reductase iron-sulfur subunit [Myxococcales bacterium]